MRKVLVFLAVLAIAVAVVGTWVLTFPVLTQAAGAAGKEWTVNLPLVVQPRGVISIRPGVLEATNTPDPLPLPTSAEICVPPPDGDEWICPGGTAEAAPTVTPKPTFAGWPTNTPGPSPTPWPTWTPAVYPGPEG